MQGYCVNAQGPGVVANLEICALAGDRLPEFFQGMASEWRGWVGRKEWSSLEGQFELKAITDGRGHITLAYSLSSGHPEYDWTLNGKLKLEAGQLDAIAFDIIEFFQSEAT